MADEDTSLLKVALIKGLEAVLNAADKGAEAAAMAGALAGAAATAAELAERVFRLLPDARLAEALRAERKAELEQNAVAIRAALARLIDSQHTQTGLLTHIVVIFDAWSRARSRAADSKKAVTVQAPGKFDHFAGFQFRDRRAERDVIYVRRWIPSAA